jgi:hypothetical protein
MLWDKYFFEEAIEKEKTSVNVRLFPDILNGIKLVKGSSGGWG